MKNTGSSVFYPLEDAYRMVSHQNQTTQKLTVQYPIQALKQATEKQIAYTLWQLKAHPPKSANYRVSLSPNLPLKIFTRLLSSMANNSDEG